MASSQQNVSNSGGANSITQLSLGDPPPTTSTHLKFICQNNSNLHGNLLFPLAENLENPMTHTRKITSNNILKYLKSKRIVKNIEIHKTFKTKQHPNTYHRRFPLADIPIEMANFPFKAPREDNFYDLHRKREINFKNLTFPFKVVREKRIFPYNSKGSKVRTEKDLQVKYCKVRELNSKLKQCSYIKRTLRKLPLDTNLKRFPRLKVLNIEDHHEFPLQANYHSLYKTNKNDCKFPIKLAKNKEIFPVGTKSESKIKIIHPKYHLLYHIQEISPLILNVKACEEHEKQTINKKFPCQFSTLGCISKFPINNQFTQYEYSFNNNNLGNLCNINMSKNSKTPNLLPSLSMTHTDLQMENIDNEHVPQVQDAQVEENPQSLTTAENKHPSPQAAKFNSIYDDVNILTDINSINNTRPNEVGYYAKKIELLQDVIIALFEKIQNSLTTNHNSEYESQNAAKCDHGDANKRFASTPTMSETSVQNTTESKNHNIEEAFCENYDRGDLGDLQVGQFVERSDVRDTFAEADHYGITKENTKRSLSILVKSEESTFPNFLFPNPLPESEQTSFENYSNNSELLSKNNVLAVNEKINVDVIHTSNLEFDSKSNELAYETVTNKREIATASEMTVSQLKKKEAETLKEKNSPKTNETIENKNETLYNDLQLNEMKYDMNRVKGALPSSVSERSLSKYDGVKTGTSSTKLLTDTPLNNNRLSYTPTSAKNHNETSYAPRSYLKHEISSLRSTSPKRSSLTALGRQDGNTSLSATNATSINDNVSNRDALNSTRSSNDSSGDALSSHRRTSLGSLRNSQLTSLVSVDLPRCSPLDTSDKTSLANRAVSVDSSVLPERTRLRRQRRLRTQDSKDEPEDPMERLSLLKARISASLNEVKGVLKQYSTDTENENENQTSKVVNSVTESTQDENREGPITFRFVKKIRRRSIFTEDDEPEQNHTSADAQPPNDETDKHVEKQLEIKNDINNCKLETESILPSQSSVISETSNKQPVEKEIEAKSVNDMEMNAKLYTLKEEAQECLQDLPAPESKPQIPIEIQKTSNDQVQTLKEEEEAKGAIPKSTVKQDTNKLKNDPPQETSKKPKKKIIIKSKNPSRRASLAAVEGSKIEPPVKLALPAQIQRRPSDSAAVLQKISITDKLNTSGVVEEVTPQPKIVKVKTSSIEINNNNNLQLAKAQTKSKEQETIENAISDNLVKPIDKDQNKSIHTDKSKDILMPKPEAEKQLQFNNEITSQANVLQPTQLVIDEAASLNEKTIKNSMLQPRQHQHQQQRRQKQKHQREQDQQATINSAATNFLSNDLQAKGAMLENVTTVLSSSTASEANGQIKREKVVQQEDLHDLLQQETTLIKPATTNQKTELKLVKHVESDQSKVKDIANDNLNVKLESVQTTTKERKQLQQKSPIHQQVIAAVDVAHVKSHEGNNKNEDIKAKVSSKEPSKDKIITSSQRHLEAEHQQRDEEQSITNTDDTKTVSSPHISISSTSDSTYKTTTASQLPAESVVEKKAEVPANKNNTMPELQLAPAPVQTADIISHPELHQKNAIIKKIVRQTSTDKNKKTELQKTKSPEESEQTTVQPSAGKTEVLQKTVEKIPSDTILNQTNPTQHSDQNAPEISAEHDQEEVTEECSESTEISESSASIGSEEPTATLAPKKERKVKKKVIIKRQKRRLSIGDTFFQSANSEGQQNADIETLEKPISYVTDDEAEHTNEKAEELRDDDQEPLEEKKPLKSCILQKEYNIGDEVLYAERFKKTQIKWRRGRVKERITSISYLLDIDGKDVSSHINYLKRFTGRKVSFGGKEYLEIDYEQLAEEEEKAEKLQRRSYSIWNMV